jgi:spermidine export protein MdtI
MIAAFSLVVLAALLDIAANVFLERSDGFRRILPGIAALVLIALAFLALVPAVKVIDLSIAYATWGAIGILGTTLAGRFFLGQHLNRTGWAGLVVIVASVVLLTMSAGGH